LPGGRPQVIYTAFLYFVALPAEEAVVKVRSSVKRICEKCKLIKRKGVVRVICEDPRHKQRQG